MAIITLTNVSIQGINPTEAPYVAPVVGPIPLNTINLFANDTSFPTTSWQAQLQTAARLVSSNTSMVVNAYTGAQTTGTSPASIANMIGTNIVNVVWANSATTTTGDLSTYILNNGGKVITCVFASIAYARATYNLTEQASMSSTYQLLSSTGQSSISGSFTVPAGTSAVLGSTLPGTSTTVPSGTWFTSTTPTLLQGSAITLLTTAGSPYAAVYKTGGVGHAQINLWPGSFMNASTGQPTFFNEFVARIANYLVQ